MSLQTATLMRLFVDEADRHGKKPLFEAIVETLRASGFAGATVIKGIAGYGAQRQLRTARAFDLSTNLPVLIEVAETEEKIRFLIPKLREMVPEGLITLQRIQMRFIRTPR
jgi:uncharacterized protein